jgi:hypothetical protein
MWDECEMKILISKYLRKENLKIIVKTREKNPELRLSIEIEKVLRWPFWLYNNEVAMDKDLQIRIKASSLNFSLCIYTGIFFLG